MDYMDEVRDLLNRIPDVETDEEMLEFLKSEYDSIKKIADHVRQVPMYKDNLDKVKEYVLATKDKSLVDRWKIFLAKCIEAPLIVMLQGVVIFHIPILEDEIKRYL